MRDRFFFPSALLLAALMVAFSLQLGAGRLPSGPVGGAGTDYKTIRVEGEQLNRMVAGGVVGLGLVETDSGATVLRIETSAGTLPDDPLRGPHFQLDRDLETMFEGQRLRITVRVRPSTKYGAMQFKANYSTGRRESGWQTFNLVPDFKNFSFEYAVPRKADTNEAGYDYLAIRPVTPEKTRAIEIERIIIERLGAGEAG